MSGGGKGGAGGLFGNYGSLGGLDPFQASLVTDLYGQSQAATGARYAQLGLGDSTMATQAANANRLASAGEAAHIEQGNISNQLQLNQQADAASGNLANALGMVGSAAIGAAL